MANVRFDYVSKRYGKVTAVEDLSMEVRSGEFFALVGPSGCGKSTVLRLVAGLEEVTSGSIYIGGAIVNHLQPSDRDVAMVFESPSYALYPHLTAYDNMAFSLRLRKHAPPVEPEPGAGPKAAWGREAEEAREGEIRKRVEDVAGRLGLRGVLGRRRTELSAGHSQSVALGRAMVREPKVFLMDDPLSQVDAQMRASGHAELREFHRRLGATIIYVTHDQAEAMALANRIGVMNEGALQQVGTPQALYDHPANMFVAGFIGSPPMNMFFVVAEDTTEGLFMAGPAFRLRVPEHYAARLAGRERANIVLGIRAEHIQDARFSPNADPATVVSAHVEAREYLGSDIYLHLTTGGQEFTARMSGRTDARPGDTLDVVFDTTRMHAFDPVSQRTLL